MRRLSIVLLLLATATSNAATPPMLDAKPASTCPVKGKGDWSPSQAEILILEQAMPPYFQRLRLKEHQLPASGNSYARQYTGIIRNGKRLIYGLFYPACDDLAVKARAGECWEVSDGGNRYWSITFDPKAKTFIAFTVNGHA